jgi:hypothetical protein
MVKIGGYDPEGFKDADSMKLLTTKTAFAWTLQSESIKYETDS